MRECKAAIRWSYAAIIIAIIALAYATWYLPGLIAVLNKLSRQIEVQDARGN